MKQNSYTLIKQLLDSTLIDIGEESPAAVEEEEDRSEENIKRVRTERGLEALCDVQGLQGGRGFHVGEGHGTKLNEAQGDSSKKCQGVQPAFVFEVSVSHGGN